MIKRKIAAGVLLSAFVMPTAALAQTAGAKTATVPPPIPKVQPAPAMQTDAVSKIKDEGMNRSQAMATMRYLTDVIGARLTNSPSQRRSNQWTKEQFEKWGLQNAKVDPWGEFGRGWELKRFNASVTAPEYMVLRAYPKAWSPSTAGAVTGDVIFVDAADEAGLEKYKGKLKGAIVLTAAQREVEPGFRPAAARRDEKSLSELENAKLGQPAQGSPFQYTDEQRRAAEFNVRKFRFFHEEGAAVLVEPSFGVDSGTIRVMGASIPAPAPVPGQPFNPFAGPRVYSKDAPKVIPQIVAETEQYNRLVRLAKQGTPIKMTVDLDVKFYDDDLQGYNTIAEIPGTDLKDEVVMIGAHLDSWHAGTGATDNGAGVTVVMEAMRILQTSGLKPRRTIRVALWTGEEQGLLGSRGYVAKNFATVGDGTEGASMRSMMGAGGKLTVTKKPAYDKFAAYYNLDNGTGKIRGIYMQGNEQLRPIFREWLNPFAEMGASTVTVNSTGGTDHLAFDAIGLPGFQFIQDPIEYTTRTWHTTQDVSDRTIEDDLKASATIMAAFAYNSAMSDQKLPRKDNPNLDLRAMFKLDGGEAAMDELAFRASGLEFAICGHNMNANEVPQTFPSAYALKPGLILGE